MNGIKVIPTEIFFCRKAYSCTESGLQRAKAGAGGFAGCCEVNWNELLIIKQECGEGPQLAYGEESCTDIMLSVTQQDKRNQRGGVPFIPAFNCGKLPRQCTCGVRKYLLCAWNLQYSTNFNWQLRHQGKLRN